MASNNNKNSLIDLKGTWIGDGGGSLSIATSAAANDEEPTRTVLSVASVKQGTPFNVMYDTSSGNLDKPVLSSFCFQVDVQELKGNLSVGLVQKEQFLQGWKTRGMFYNGNVTNGSSALLVGFGDHIKQHDKIGVMLSTKQENVMEAIFYMNGQCLGPAFQIAATGASSWYPCIHVSGEAKLAYSTPSTLFDTTIRSSVSLNDDDDDSYEGDWKITRLFKGPELGEFPLPPGRDIVMNIQQNKQQPGIFQLAIKVANTIRGQVQVVGKMEAFDKIQVSPNLVSTMMMPSPEWQATEQAINEALPTLYKMIVSKPASTASLIMTGPAAELMAERYTKTFEPLDRYM